MKFVCNYIILLFCVSASAFTSSTYSTFNRAQIGTRKSTAIGAAAKKTTTKSKKKSTKKSTKKKVATKTEVETVRKAEFVSKIADKTGLTKADSEAALSAVLDTITEVSQNCTAIIIIAAIFPRKISFKP